MSFRTRVEKIARQQAEIIAAQLVEQRIQQVQTSNTTMGEIIKTNGVDLTIRLQDGTETQATALGNRYIGTGDAGLFNAGVFQ